MSGSAARKALVGRREVLLSELEVTQQALVDIRRLRSDRLDDDEHDPEGAPLSAEWSRLQGLHRVAQQRVAELDAALSNFDDGHYGNCLKCGQPISAGRLEALPTATLCIGCASRAHRNR